MSVLVGEQLQLNLGLRLCAARVTPNTLFTLLHSALVNQSTKRQPALYLGFNHFQTVALTIFRIVHSEG